MIQSRICWIRFINITNKVKYSWRISVYNISLEGKNKKNLFKNDVEGANIWQWETCRNLEKTKSMNEVYKSGIWWKEYKNVGTIRIFLSSSINLWNVVIKPISFDTEFFEISRTNKYYKERDLSELLNNIYILFDYSVNEYWI